MADIPQNRKQAYNFNMSQREGHIAERHEVYDVLELLNKGTLVRDFDFAKSSIPKRTQPRSFQATNFQLSELSRVCISQKYIVPFLALQGMVLAGSVVVGFLRMV